jgi:predicted kinase
VTGPPGRPAPAPAGWFVLVAGWPAAGKSTLARALAAELGLPLLAKDEIKEALMDGLGYPATVAQSRRLGRAAVAAMLRVAQRCPGAVLDSTWFEYADPLVRQLPGRCAEVICTVPVELARARYQARAGQRHAGHLDEARTEAELWGAPPRSPRAGPVLEVDTSGPVDVHELAATLSRLLGADSGT